MIERLNLKNMACRCLRRNAMQKYNKREKNLTIIAAKSGSAIADSCASMAAYL
jgi:hypothetical protein